MHDPEHEPTVDEDSGDEVLLFETSPFGNIDAIVQQDGRCVYFYLNGRDSNSNNPFGTRACWVRNLQMGPYVINDDEMRDGVAPMLPRTHCVSTKPCPLPSSDELAIVWFEEGNGAALVENVPNQDPTNSATPNDQSTQRTLAVIPPWSGMDGFHGYAAECAAESQLCWPLPDNPNLQQRIKRAADFWQSLLKSPDPFAIHQPKILETYDQRFLRQNGNADSEFESCQYYAIDGGKFPPRGLAKYLGPTKIVLATVAMSICPQPMVEMFVEDPQSARRIELAIELSADLDEATLNQIIESISGLANYPWQKFSWFGDGHTCDFPNVVPGVDTIEFVSDVRKNPDDPVQLPSFRNDPVQLLWVSPK